MKIGLYNVDSKIPNLALMKLSAFHKAQGNCVEWYSPLFHNEYDKIYASKVFTFSDNGYLKNDMIIGGSGWNLKCKLPEEIEHIYPDYSLYPKCDYSMGFLTRGCIRSCDYCIVPRKEGTIRKNADYFEFTKDQKRIMLLDNNILAYKGHLDEFKILIESGKHIDFNQGLDIRLINKRNAILLSKIKKWKGLRLRFALDDINLIPLVKRKLSILNDAGIKNNHCQFYVLIGYNSTPKEDLRRIQFLHSRNCAIFVMPYKKTEYCNKFARWINRYFYKYETFQDYLRGVRT